MYMLSGVASSGLAQLMYNDATVEPGCSAQVGVYSSDDLNCPALGTHDYAR